MDRSDRKSRIREYKEGGSHPDAELQADWNELGEQAFEFAVLDRLEPHDDPDYDPTDDLAVLQSMWRDRLMAAGQAFYEEGMLGHGLPSDEDFINTSTGIFRA